MADKQPGSFPITNQFTTADMTPGAAVPEHNADERPIPLRTSPTPVSHPDEGTGIVGETLVWEASYSLWNFAGRLVLCTLLTLAWVGFTLYTRRLGRGGSGGVVTTLGIALAALWIWLICRILLARFQHYYRLTTRRLFISTGILMRRRDQLELLRVEDVFTKQSLVGRWLSIGTVVVVSSEESLPRVALPGVANAKHVMDLIWHHARAERDQRSVKVQEI